MLGVAGRDWLCFLSFSLPVLGLLAAPDPRWRSKCLSNLLPQHELIIPQWRRTENTAREKVRLRGPFLSCEHCTSLLELMS
uniref:Secreted protein n=1 Tax=Monodelphis domestica TaxID=13616 RepID=A0A5F8GNQ9_MONDO